MEEKRFEIIQNINDSWIILANNINFKNALIFICAFEERNPNTKIDITIREMSEYSKKGKHNIFNVELPSLFDD